MTPHPSVVEAARAIVSYSDATGAELDEQDVPNVADKIESHCHVTELAGLLTESQEYIGGDWRQRRDEVLRKLKEKP